MTRKKRNGKNKGFAESLKGSFNNPKIKECNLEDIKKYYIQKQQEEEKTFQNMLQELQGIKNIKKPLSTYQQARFLIYSALVQCWEERENIIDPQIEKQIREAGEMLYQYGGINALHDNLLWSFIPKSLEGEIEIIWDGIGSWIA